jgi:hypothetical protein
MTIVTLSTFFETQDYKNMCLNYYNELDTYQQKIIDGALDLDYNPNAISYKGVSSALSKNKKSINRTGKYSGGVKRFNK